MVKVLLAVAALLAMPASAAEVLRTPPPTLAPTGGYVLVRLGERAPDVWNPLTLAAYDEAAQDIRGKGRAKANAVPQGADRTVTIGAKPFIAEEGHVRTYLVALTPGRYVVQSGPTTCYCLGSYSFEVVAGRITDLGTIYLGPENGTSPWAQLKPLHSTADIEERGYTVADAMAVLPFRDGMSVPAAVAALLRQPADYRPAPRFGNHDGQLLNKALPLEIRP